MIVLDTNVISEVMKTAPHERVQQWLDSRVADTLYVSTVNIAEIMIGIELLPDGNRKNRLRELLEQITERFFRGRVLEFDVAGAKTMAVLNRSAVSKGHNILSADCQIAAIAAVHGFAVATRDEAPFRAAGVPVINPWTA